MRVLTLSFFAAILSAPAFAADLGTYRPGAPYHSIVAPGANVCESQCTGDAQCRGWNYVKTNPQAPGVCEFLSSVSSPIASQISISGLNGSAAPYSPSLTAGGTNTIRVGTQAAPKANTVSVRQSASGRRIVRQAPTQRLAPQRASTKPVENMSLTEQQNRFRQGITAAPRSAAPHAPHAPTPQRPVFRQHLGAPYPHPQTQSHQIQQQQARKPQRQSSRRATGPRRAIGQQTPPYPAQTAPQHQTPHYQLPQAPAATYSQATAQSQNLRRGSSRPPVGQPIPPTTRAPAQLQVSTPSQRLAQFTAQAKAQGAATAPVVSGPIALSPEQARTSLFGSLNDNVASAEATSTDIPFATAVPTQPVTQEALDDVLAGGL